MTPKDIEDTGKKKLEDAAWYQKDYGVKNSNGSKKYNKKEKLLELEISTLWEMITLTQHSMSVQERMQACQVLL